MKRRILTGLLTLALLAILTIEFIPVSVLASIDYVSISVKSNYDIPALTTYGWINAKPVMTDDVNYQWVNGAPYIIMTATTSATYDFTLNQSSKALGTVAVSTTYWTNGSAPEGNLDDVEAYLTITSTGSAASDIDVHGHDATGGVGWTLTSDAPGSNQYRMKFYVEGDAVPAGGDYITTSPQEIISNLGAGANIDAEISIETGSAFTDGEPKSILISLSSRAVS